MQLFYGFKEGENVHLTEDESRHAVKVLRKKSGDQIHVMDGLGHLFSGPITVDHPKKCVVHIEEITDNWGLNPYEFHLAIAPTKNIDRLEWLCEKAVEIGITRITPLLCRHSERKVLKPERLERILLSAAKQSLKGILPQLDPLTPLEEFVTTTLPYPRYIGYCGEGEKLHLTDLLNKSGSTCCVMIGPEGDFSPDEFDLARNAGIIPVTLGEQRLRTETAGLLAVSTAHTLYQIYLNK